MLAPLDTYVEHGGHRPSTRRNLTVIYRLLADRPGEVILTPGLLEFGGDRPAWGVNGRSRHGDLNVSNMIKEPFSRREDAVAYHQAIAAMIADAAVRVRGADGTLVVAS